jgi:transposase
MNRTTKRNRLIALIEKNPEMPAKEIAKRAKVSIATVYKARQAKMIFEYVEPPANEIQEGGRHYKEMTIQTWDYIIANKIGYMEGNVIKYVSRWKDKGGIEDLKKARHYLDKLIEVSK